MPHTTQTLSIDSLAYGGDGVGRIGDKIVFVPDTVPGDVAYVRITEDRGTYYRGVTEHLEIPSPARVEPFCPYADRCGGCQWQMIGYPDQLRWKQTILEETLRRIGGLENMTVEPCVPSPNERACRTVARYQAEPGDEGIRIGYYGRRSHDLIDIDTCPVATDGVNETAAIVRRILNETNNICDISEITIRASFNHPSGLITMNVSGGGSYAFAESLMKEKPELSGVVLRSTSGKHIRTFGSPFHTERIGSKQFRIGEQSFFQVNVPQTEQLTEIVCAMLHVEPGGAVIDAYGGVGLFSLMCCPEDTVIHLCDTGKTAVADAKYNARVLGYGDFHAYISETLNAVPGITGAGAIILDPPRTGIGMKTVDALCSLEAPVIVYVSCNPATLARDLGYFVRRGYAVRRAVPVDMFPHTYHIETVVKLERA